MAARTRPAGRSLVNPSVRRRVHRTGPAFRIQTPARARPAVAAEHLPYSITQPSQPAISPIDLSQSPQNQQQDSRSSQNQQQDSRSPQNQQQEEPFEYQAAQDPYENLWDDMNLFPANQEAKEN